MNLFYFDLQSGMLLPYTLDDVYRAGFVAGQKLGYERGAAHSALLFSDCCEDDQRVTH